jgi:secondary thiamine-phosphate synthase enzyme
VTPAGTAFAKALTGATETAWPFLARCERVEVRTERPFEIVDVTDLVAQRVRCAGLVIGIVTVQTAHTTTAILVNEHEPLLLEDLRRLLERLAPQGARYRHDDLDARRPRVASGERRNGHAHCRAMLLPSSATLNVRDGRIELGCWQRILLVELDGARKRTLSISVLGAGGGPVA